MRSAGSSAASARKASRFLEGQDAGERDRQAELDRLHRKLASAGVAMQHGAERALRHLLFEDAAAILVGVAGVDHQRQAGGARGGDMGAEAARLRLARAVLVEIIEPRLAERDDLRMPGQLDQFVGRNAVFLVGVMRMGADRAIDIRKALGDREQRRRAAAPASRS